MELIDLERPKRKTEEAKEVAVGEEDRYPYGTRVNLEKQELDKLGLKPADFVIGTKCSVVAEGEVIGLRESANKNNESKSVEIQLTKMAVKAPKGKGKGAYKKFSEIQEAGPGGEA